MKKSKFSESQIVAILKEADAGMLQHFPGQHGSRFIEVRMQVFVS